MREVDCQSVCPSSLYVRLPVHKTAIKFYYFCKKKNFGAEGKTTLKSYTVSPDKLHYAHKVCSRMMMSL